MRRRRCFSCTALHCTATTRAAAAASAAAAAAAAAPAVPWCGSFYCAASMLFFSFRLKFKTEERNYSTRKRSRYTSKRIYTTFVGEYHGRLGTPMPPAAAATAVLYSSLQEHSAIVSHPNSCAGCIEIAAAKQLLASPAYTDRYNEKSKSSFIVAVKVGDSE